MVAGLREREHLRDLFGRHVGQEVAEAAAEPARSSSAARPAWSSVLFVDLVGSTTYASEHSPAEVVEMLNRFFGVVVDEVDRRHGLVNKFIGDAVLAIFGAPVALPTTTPGAALAAARAMADRLAEEVPEIGAGIGVATGEVVAGNVGHAPPLRVHGDRRRRELRGPAHRARQGRRRAPARHLVVGRGGHRRGGGALAADGEYDAARSRRADRPGHPARMSATGRGTAEAHAQRQHARPNRGRQL